MAHPDKRIGKAHSSVVIAVQSDDHAKHILKHGLYILGQHRKTVKFLGAKPTDQCSTCQQFGHHWQRCDKSPICGYCAEPHNTLTHECTLCNFRGRVCVHTKLKCHNCNGLHRANDPQCEIINNVRHECESSFIKIIPSQNNNAEDQFQSRIENAEQPTQSK
jgi:hypothetical protein